jgi:DNA-binding NarL/FixJ family response regulator
MVMKTAESRVWRVMVIDDHVLVRVGVARLVDDLPGFACVGTAADAVTGLNACRSLQPDVLLLDMNLPPPAGEPEQLPGTLQGLEVARALAAELPQLRIVVLSARTDPDTVRRALRTGVAGYIGKDFCLDELEQALRTALAGHRWLSPSVAGALEATERPVVRLTPRQRDVLSLIARGLSNKEIARQLAVSVKTVEYHRAEVIARLDLHDVASLTRFAIEQGL